MTEHNTVIIDPSITLFECMKMAAAIDCTLCHVRPGMFEIRRKTPDQTAGSLTARGTTVIDFADYQQRDEHDAS